MRCNALSLLHPTRANLTFGKSALPGFMCKVELTERLESRIRGGFIFAFILQIEYVANSD